MNQIVFPNRLEVDFCEAARRIGTQLHFAAGDIAFGEGDAPHYMNIVLDGALDMTCGGKVIESIGPGDALGVIGLLDGKPRSATALVTRDAELAG